MLNITQEDIDKSHPTKTGRHSVYALALELVSDRQSKRDLVDLVNHLLSKIIEDRPIPND